MISIILPIAAGVSRASRQARATSRRGRLLLSCWSAPEYTTPSDAARLSSSLRPPGRITVQSSPLCSSQCSPSRFHTRIKPNRLSGCNQRPAQRELTSTTRFKPTAWQAWIWSRTPIASTCRGPARFTDGRAPVAITRKSQPLRALCKASVALKSRRRTSSRPCCSASARAGGSTESGRRIARTARPRCRA